MFNAHGATVNDAVLALVAGALRQWMTARYGHLAEIRVKAGDTVGAGDVVAIIE